MLVGRREEIQSLNEAFQGKASEFIALFGRRRVGKTFLINEVYRDKILFSHTGIYGKTLSYQLQAFYESLLGQGFDEFDKPKNWMEAFRILKSVISKSTKKKKIIFLDELSWMDTPKSNFLTALEFFWNGWANARHDVILVICASSTSWMINKVIHNKGGLHNRLTRQLFISPFTLGECEELCNANHIAMNRYQMLMCYMIMGGIPYYWSLLKKGKSLDQNIDEIFFGEKAQLKSEYKYLYASLFKNPEQYMNIVEALGKHKTGMLRNELIDTLKVKNTGTISDQLEELEQCGFIRKYQEFDKKKKGSQYQLIDNFTLFYFKFIEKGQSNPHFWSEAAHRPATDSWAGLAFERVCLQHIEQIKNGLGIRGVITNVHSWRCPADPDNGINGSQIDLLIVRKDQIIDLCEMKYSSKPYMLKKIDNESIENKKSDLYEVTHTKYAIHTVMITPEGLKRNSYSDNIQAVITAEDLFS